MIATVALLTAVFSAASASCPVEGGGPPFSKPTPDAAQANADANKAYFKKDFAGAIGLYQRALQLDPKFLSARINLASAFARAERFEDATREAVAAIDAAYVPGWFRVNEATDLLVLQSLPSRKHLEGAGSRGAASWGIAANQGLLVIARTGAGLKSGGDDQSGVFVVAPHQEVFSWDPVHGGFHQVTAEEGRVVAMAHDRAAGRLVYTRADKIVRAPGKVPLWRGLTVRILDLKTMSLSERIPVPGDLSELSLTMETTGGRTQPILRGRADGRPVAMTVSPEGLVQYRGIPPRNAASRVNGTGKCRFRVEAVLLPEPRIRITPVAGRRFDLDTPFGAFLGTALP
jgi:hypothetical protein